MGLIKGMTTWSLIVTKVPLCVGVTVIGTHICEDHCHHFTTERSDQGEQGADQVQLVCFMH